MSAADMHRSSSTLSDCLECAPGELLEQAACELCGSGSSVPVVREDFAGQCLRAVRCCDSGFCYTSPRPTLRFSQALRTPEVRNRLVAAGVLEPERQLGAATVFDYAHQLASDSNYRRGLAALKRVRVHGTLLDIGCAGGRFVELAREAGYEALGCDISQAAVTEGRARGLDLHLAPPNGLPEGLPPPAVATLWNVLEHAQRPLALLRALRQVTQPDAVVLIEVPNMALRLALSRLRGCHHSFGHRYMLYEHIYHYTPHSLKRLLALSGFRPMRFLTGHSDGSSDRRSRSRAVVCRMAARITGGLVNWHYPLACLARPL